MRHLIVLGLTVGIVAPAVAQTEVIIRRPGEKDQVIHLDSTRTGSFSFKWDSNTFKWDSAPLREQAMLFNRQAESLRNELSSRRVDSLMSQLSRIKVESLDVQRLAMRSRQAQDEMKSAMTNMNRAIERVGRRQPHLGVVIETASRETDRYGAYISAVTPGSPAEKAGIMAGDIITRIAGQSVLSKSARNDDEESASPGLRLITLISALKPGKQVDVELRRGTQTRTVKVTPQEDDDVVTLNMMPKLAQGFGEGFGTGVGVGDVSPRVRLQATPMPPMAMSQGFSFDNVVPSASTFYISGTNSLFGNLELTAMNDKLGSYFGTGEGVLVVNTMTERRPFIIRNKVADSAYRVGRGSAPARARVDTFDTDGNRIDQPRASTLGLEPGDVIVSVDGRKVTTPSQLMRIVATYDHGDEFKLQIMRQKHAETLPVKMP
jgi:S1-C subfamily serine protease